MTSVFIQHFFLAESGYEKELSFTGGKSTTLENKVRKPVEKIVRGRDPHVTKLLFSGTLSESTGVFIAIALAQKLHQLDPRLRLTIIGYCPQQEVCTKLKNAIKSFSFITLIGGENHVAHSDIIDQISHADFGIIAYPANKSTATSIPTKLYEYLGYKLPILLINHQPWVTLCERYGAAIVFDEKQPDAQLIASQMESEFYTSDGPDVFWECEEAKLLDVINRLT
jgi:hypothetical protein